MVNHATDCNPFANLNNLNQEYPAMSVMFAKFEYCFVFKSPNQPRDMHYHEPITMAVVDRLRQISNGWDVSVAENDAPCNGDNIPHINRPTGMTVSLSKPLAPFSKAVFGE